MRSVSMPSGLIRLCDAVAGWSLGTGLALLLAVTHPVPMVPSLVVRNVLIAGAFAGVLLTLLITGVRDWYELR